MELEGGNRRETSERIARGSRKERSVKTPFKGGNSVVKLIRKADIN